MEASSLMTNHISSKTCLHYFWIIHMQKNLGKASFLHIENNSDFQRSVLFFLMLEILLRAFHLKKSLLSSEREFGPNRQLRTCRARRIKPQN